MAGKDISDSVAEILLVEAQALQALADAVPRQSEAIAKACTLILDRCGDGKAGRLVVTGVGKAGLVGRKISATFASTGSPSFFLHPSDARHGDLGMVQAGDVILAFSNSGSSEEITCLLPSLKHIGVPIVAVVGNPASPLAEHAAVVLDIGKVTEACPLGLAPSTSTTTMLALGDALALTVHRQRKFTPQQYSRYHPGGALGRRLMTCREAMRSGERVARVGAETPVVDVMRAITKARAGSAMLVDADDKLLGIFTDGDLRRALEKKSGDPAEILQAPVRHFATIPCLSVPAEELLQSALHLCAEKKKDELPVVDNTGKLVGMLDLQDLVDRGFEVEKQQGKGAK